jgi:hypothetical protein
VDPQQLRDYAGRAWHLVEAHKRSYWARVLREEGVLATFEAAQALWTHMRQLRPEWPRAEDREEDLAHHLALTRSLDRAASAITVRSSGR